MTVPAFKRSRRNRHTGRGWALLGLAAGALLTPDGVAAQDTLSSGELLRQHRIRVLAPDIAGEFLVGHVTAIDSAQLFIKTREPSPIRIPRIEIRRLEVSSGLSRFEGGLLGFFAGAVAGFTVVKLGADYHYEHDDYNGLVAFLIGAPSGGLVGAIVGSKRARLEWHEVEVRDWGTP